MPISIPEPTDPESLVVRVGEAIGSRFGERFTMSAPYPVHLLDHGALTAGRLEFTTLGMARWQCLVGPSEVDQAPEEDPTGGDALAAVDVAWVDDGPCSVVSINHGAMAAAVNQAATVANQVAGEHDFWFTTIEFPELHFAAVRMVAMDDGGDDVYIPLMEPDLPPDDPTVDVGTFAFRPVLPAELVRTLQRWLDNGGPDPTPGAEPTNDRPAGGGTGAGAQARPVLEDFGEPDVAGVDA
jgi:hypothetical protein